MGQQNKPEVQPECVPESCVNDFDPKRIGQASPGTTSIEKMEGRPFSYIIGTCMTPIAVSCEEGLATATGKGLCNFVKVNWGCFCATRAWRLPSRQAEFNGTDRLGLDARSDYQAVASNRGYFELKLN